MTARPRAYLTFLGAYPVFDPGGELLLRFACETPTAWGAGGHPSGAEPGRASGRAPRRAGFSVRASREGGRPLEVLAFDEAGPAGPARAGATGGDADGGPASEGTPGACARTFRQLSVRVPAGARVVRLSVRPAGALGWLSAERLTLRRAQWEAQLRAWLEARTNAQDDPGHDAWMRARQPRDAELTRLREEGERLAKSGGPLFSVVTPVFRTPSAYLRAMVDSVLGQAYPRLELVLVNASGDCPEVDEVLAGYAGDARVRTLEVANAGIAANTNAGIAAARGDYVAFVDHDDFVEPDALLRYAQAIAERPETDVLFCDEDLYGGSAGEERYYGARFKPGWDPELACTHNYMCHLLCVSRRALDATERSGDEVNAAQDYDLTFKAAELAGAVTHVPRVLYHWREHPGSTAENRDSKPYALEAGRLAVDAHLRRVGVTARVEEGAFPFSYRVRYELPASRPALTLAVDAAHGSSDDLGRLLRSLSTLGWEGPLELSLACRAGQADAVRALAARDLPGLAGAVRVTEVAEGVGAPGVSRAAALNAAARAALGELLVLLDERCEVASADMLEELAGLLLGQPGVGCAGPELLWPDDLVCACGLVARSDGSFAAGERLLSRHDFGYMTLLVHAHGAGALPPCGLMLRRADFESAGGLDDACRGLAVPDLCLRLRERGLRCVVEPYAPLRVWGDPLFTDACGPDAAARVLGRHPALAQGDPCLNPALDPSDGLYRLRGEG